MKNNYIAVIVKEDGKNYAYAIKVSESRNLLCELKIKNIVAANLFETKKRAEEVVNSWNESYKQNGTYMFSDVKF